MPRPACSLSPSNQTHYRWIKGVRSILCGLLLVTYAIAEPLLWFDNGRPNLEAQQAVHILVDAAADGLDQQDYAAHDLFQLVMNAARGELLTHADIAQLDYSLTASMQQFLADLHSGRISPDQVNAVFSKPPVPYLEPALYLRQAVAAHRLPQAIRQAAPAFPLYDELRHILGYYRELLDDPAWQTTLPPLPARSLKEGDKYAGIELLTQRLIMLGDLPVGTQATSRFSAVLSEGIKSFQKRHGLDSDGVIGKMTLPQLQVTPAERVRQIELTMERLRWTPLLRAPRMVFINIPEFRLRAYEIYDDAIHFQLDTKVVVGKALDTRTPVFDEEMRFIEFSPYWNIPRSIARAEIVPKLRKEPEYFQKQGLEFVTRDRQAWTDLTSRNLDAVMRDELRIRQRPGPENALGNIKFIFPNTDNIYLHDTPATQLFSQGRRDFSHGCIRVEDPVALAEFVLQGDDRWDTERILEAMGKGESKTIRLKEPLPVVIAYLTAMIQDDGRISFFPDIYGHDHLLDEALRQRSAALRVFSSYDQATQ